MRSALQRASGALLRSSLAHLALSLLALARAACAARSDACATRRGARDATSSFYGRFAAPGPYAPRTLTVNGVPKLGGAAQTNWTAWGERLFGAVGSQPASDVISARFVFPSSTTGDSGIAAGSWPVVGWAPGWSCNTELYAPIFARLVSHGFVVAAPLVTDVLANPFFEEQAVDFKDQTVQLFSAVAWAQHNPAWAGRIDATQLGLGGHSAGGGIAVQAAIEAGVNVTAVATLGGWVNIASTPWLASLAASMSAPAMAVSADFDTRAPTATNAAVLLNASLAPVLLPVVAEGSHCFLDWRPAQAGSPLRESAGAGSPLGSGGRLLPLAGESDCRLLNRRAEPPTCGPSEAEQMAFGATLLTAWFALYLRGDVAAAPLLWGGPSTSAWVSSVQRASRVALELLPANATVVLRAGGAKTLPLLRLRNLGPRAGRWSLSAAFAGEGGASALRATLAVPTLHLDASAAAAAAAAAAAVLPRQDALPQIITQMHTPPPRSPPAPPRRWRNSGTGRKLLQGAAGDASGDDAAEVRATLSADAGVVAGKYTLRVSATSGADGGTTAYAFVMVTVSN